MKYKETNKDSVSHESLKTELTVTMEITALWAWLQIETNTVNITAERKDLFIWRWIAEWNPDDMTQVYYSQLVKFKCFFLHYFLR